MPGRGGAEDRDSLGNFCGKRVELPPVGKAVYHSSEFGQQYDTMRLFNLPSLRLSLGGVDVEHWVVFALFVAG